MLPVASWFRESPSWSREPAFGPVGSHEILLKKFQNVCDLAPNQTMTATYMIGPYRLDAQRQSFSMAPNLLDSAGGQSPCWHAKVAPSRIGDRRRIRRPNAWGQRSGDLKDLPLEFGY